MKRGIESSEERERERERGRELNIWGHLLGTGTI